LSHNTMAECYLTLFDPVSVCLQWWETMSSPVRWTPPLVTRSWPGSEPRRSRIARWGFHANASLCWFLNSQHWFVCRLLFKMPTFVLFQNKNKSHVEGNPLRSGRCNTLQDQQLNCVIHNYLKNSFISWYNIHYVRSLAK